MEQFWIIVGSVGTVVLVLLTVWLIMLARRPQATSVANADTSALEPEVTVEIANLFETYGNPPDIGPWSFSVTGINRSNHPVRFTSAGFERQDGRQIVIRQQPYGANLICTVPPHDSGQTWIECDTLEQADLDVYGPIIGWVRTATGELYKSAPKALRSR